MRPAALKKTAKEYDIVSSLQRLGYILDNFIEDEKLTNAIYTIFQDRKTHYIPLSPNKEKEGTYNHKWKKFYFCGYLEFGEHFRKYY
jgi:predicted transcriptional regulator of viral defense system